MIPVFIGGCSRSGTTLLGAALGSHSDCLTIPEFQFKIEVLHSYAVNNKQFNLLFILKNLTKNRRFKIWQLESESNLLFEEKLEKEPAKIIEWFINKYREKSCEPLPKFWIDHTPANINYVRTLLNLFPKAKIIHIVRDGRAVASSVMPLDWGPNTITKAAPWWVERVAYGLAAESLLEKHQIIRVRYEDLIGEPELTLKTLCFYIGIEYQHSMIEARGFKVSPYTFGQHTLVGKKLDTTRLNAWKDNLTPREIEIFEMLTGDLLQYLGYSSLYGTKAREITRLERLQLGTFELYIQNFNKLRNRWRFYKSFY